MQFTITLDDATMKCLLHDLEGENGVKLWITEMIAGKAHKSGQRLLEDCRRILSEDESVTDVPNSIIGVVELGTAHVKYKNREAREEEAKALRDAAIKAAMKGVKVS